MGFGRFLLLVLLTCGSAQAQVMQRELGDFELKLGTAPTRTMAQGLVQPARASFFTGGLDLSHTTGLYFGQWAPSMGILEPMPLELNSYLGYMRPFDERLGYEVGMIHYSYPELRAQDRQAYYSGLTLYGSRLGAALSQAPNRSDSTLLLDLDLPRPWYLDMTLRYARHALEYPVYLSGNRTVRVFNDWSLNLSRPLLGLRLGFTYTGSDLGGSSCAAYSGQNAHCDDFFELRLEHSFF